MSDDDYQLPADTLAILQEFLAEKAKAEDLLKNEDKDKSSKLNVVEDWQLSQFWYSASTCSFLADVVISAAIDALGDSEKKTETGAIVACISCPSTYKAITARGYSSDDISTLKIFEYDSRFQVFGDDFVFYDYNSPRNVPSELIGNCDVIIFDPPFLQEDCLTAFTETINLLKKDDTTRVLLATGTMMYPHVSKLLKLRPTNATIEHEGSRLANPFTLYASHQSVANKCSGWNTDIEENFDDSA